MTLKLGFFKSSLIVASVRQASSLLPNSAVELASRAACSAWIRRASLGKVLQSVAIQAAILGLLWP